MSWREVGSALRAWTAGGDAAAVATLVGVRRSAPRAPGARFAVSSTGDLAGSVSSGCVEGDLHEHLMRMIGGAPPEVLTYGITDEMAAGVGLSCGGEIDVLVEAHPGEDPVWALLEEAIERGTPAVLMTGLSKGMRSRRVLIVAAQDRDAPDVATRHGSLGDDRLDAAALRAALDEMTRSDAGRLLLLEDDPASEAFAETFAPPPRLVVVGATPIAEALCGFAAAVGFEVTVVDPRAAFARAERFPAAHGVVVEWPDAAFEQIGLDRFASVVVLTHDGKLDDPALAAALDAGCGYIGLLGGRRTQKLRRDALAAAGYDRHRIDQVKGPVGLDIGARSPVQIAVSILAELIAEGRAP
jgi:xanthine dehydrogenase accessory factor